MMKVGLFLFLNSFHFLLIHTSGIILKLDTRQSGTHIIVEVDTERTVTGQLLSRDPAGCLVMEPMPQSIVGPVWLRIINPPARDEYKLSETSVCTPSINYTVTVEKLTLKVAHLTEGNQSVQVLIQCEENQILIYNDTRQAQQFSASWVVPSFDTNGWVLEGEGREYTANVTLTCEALTTANPTTTIPPPTRATTTPTMTIIPMTDTPIKVTEQRTSAKSTSPVLSTTLFTASTKEITSTTNHSIAVTEPNKRTLDPDTVMIIAIAIPVSVVVIIIIVIASVCLHRRRRHKVPDSPSSMKPSAMAMDAASHTNSGYQSKGDDLYDSVAMDTYAEVESKPTNEPFYSNATRSAKDVAELYTQVQKPKPKPPPKHQKYMGVSSGSQESSSQNQGLDTEIEMVDNELYGTAGDNTYSNA